MASRSATALLVPAFILGVSAVFGAASTATADGYASYTSNSGFQFQNGPDEFHRGQSLTLFNHADIAVEQTPEGDSIQFDRNS